MTDAKKIKVVVKYSGARDVWSVWSSPTLIDYFFFMDTGKILMGVGKTRDAALSSAQAYLEERGGLPKDYTERVELDL